MINMFKFPRKFLINDLQHELILNSAYWDEQKNIYYQMETKAISLRAQKKEMGKHIWDCQKTYDQPWLNDFPKSKQFLDEFIERYGGELGMATYTLLPPDKKVYAHDDYGEYYKIRDRFHLTVRGEYTYRVGDETATFKTGELWWFENTIEHEAHNISSINRISLIFDVLNSKWRKEYGFKGNAVGGEVSTENS
jgi:hypothetical protein